MAEASPLAGALDQAGDVGHDVLGAVVEAHDAEVGLERGERVVGDLGLGGRDAADERGLAHVREPDQRHVGQQLELEAQPALLALLALLGERRRPAAVGEEPGVAPPAPAALGGQVAVAGARPGRRAPSPSRVAHDRALAARRPRRPRPRRPWRPLPLPWVPSVAPAERVVRNGEQRRHVVVGDQPDVAAGPAVAAVGAAPGDVRLAAERDRARPRRRPPWRAGCVSSTNWATAGRV